ncbi:MAG: phosphatase PAP2 family protein [Terracidiphilus sp.]
MIETMRPGDAVSLFALLFLVVIGWVRPISPKQRRQIVGLGLVGTALIASAQLLSKYSPAAAKAVGDWLPCLLILIVYWQAGRFSSTPNKKLQTWLVEFDRQQLGSFLDQWSRKWSATWIGTYFEIAYLFCYALIPIGVGVLCWTNLRSAIDEYWATVLPASYLCYLIVPFAQTLPPRLLCCAGDATPAKQKIRSFNLFILRYGSIQLNTFPSAHVASTVGASLVLMKYVPAAGAIFLLISLSIAAGAVFGRYHYALDVIFGAMLPVCVAAWVLGH